MLLLRRTYTCICRQSDEAKKIAATVCCARTLHGGRSLGYGISKFYPLGHITIPISALYNQPYTKWVHIQMEYEGITDNHRAYSTRRWMLAERKYVRNVFRHKIWGFIHIVPTYVPIVLCVSNEHTLGAQSNSNIYYHAQPYTHGAWVNIKTYLEIMCNKNSLFAKYLRGFSGIKMFEN